MFASIAQLLAASALFSVGLSAPIPSGPASERDVGVLTCKTVHTGPLQYSDFAMPYGHGNAALNGVRDGEGRQILVTLDADGQPAEEQQFNFQACTSNKAKSFMGFDALAKNGQAYGHISPVNAPHHCLTLSALGSSNQRFVSDKCSYSDDSSQLFQYFVLAQNAITTTFIGHENRTDNKPVYQLSLGNTPQKKVQVDYEPQGVSYDEGISLRFTPPSY